MAYVHIGQSGQNLYIYGSVNMRREGSKHPIRVTKCLGKINQNNNKPEFNEKYIPWMEKYNLHPINDFNKYVTNTPKYNYIDIDTIDLPKTAQTPILKLDNFSQGYLSSNMNITIDDFKHISTKFIGATYLLKHISDNIGLTNILEETFPYYWKEILSLAFFFTIETDPLMYCKFFVDFFDNLSMPSDLTSQRISKLFDKISDDEKSIFYQKWANHVQELDYIAFDTTSILTYSTLMYNADYGHSKQPRKKGQKQVNICLLFGENTGLPLYSCTYNGSINDVAIFISCAKQFSHISDNNLKLVLDRGMYSKKNLTYMLSSKPAKKFIIGLPSTTSLKSRLIDECKDLLFSINNTITTLKDNIYGTTKRFLWENSNYLYAHIFIDQNKYIEKHNELQNKIIDMYNNAIDSPLSYINDKEYNEYLIFRVNNKSENGYSIKKNQDAFDNALSKAGWFVFLSNNIKDTTEAINVYRKRDIVEKAFNIFKNRTQEQNLAVHSDINTSNKLFISFLSLILTSQINKVMVENNLYKTYTIKELFFNLKSIKKMTVKNYKIYSQLTAKQKDILEYFDCPFPIDES